MVIFDPIPEAEFDRVCPVCGGACGAEMVRRYVGCEEPATEVFASCQRCAWTGPADATRERVAAAEPLGVVTR